MTNPLLTPFELPPFSKILPEHVVPAVTKALNDCRENVERVVAQGAPYTWENLCQPLAEVDDVLGRIFSPVSHLNSVKNSPELREAYEQTLPLLSEYSTWVGQHEGLYKAYRDLRDGDHYATLNTAQKKAVDNALRDFELSGIGLPIEKQQRYGEIATRLSELGNQYSNNVLDATMGWTKLVTDEAELAGMPESALAAAKAQAEAKELEGYLLTGRHGFFASYESFIRVVDSMVAQHAKWLKVCSQLPWRQSIASLNLILTSNVWQQDHNGFTHQDPGFLDHIANKKADVVRLYLPPDTNCLLSCFDHCVRSRDYVNVLVTSKHPRPQWLTMEQAVKHCTQGVGIWDWASSDAGEEPDVVMACCGDTPTLETLAAVTILRDAMPELKIRVVNVVDLMKLEPNTKHPHGLSDADYDALFTKDKPIIFAFHGYPTLIHELTYERTNRNLSVHGYQEEGTITTPFDMRVQNEIDRFHLVKDALQHLPQLGNKGAYLIQQMNDKLVAHKNYIHEVGQDLPEIIDWKWHLPENK